MSKKFFYNQFDYGNNEKLRRRNRFVKRMQAKMRFKQSIYG